MIKWFKILLWRVNLLPEDICPLCGKGLYPHFGEWTDVWTCYNEACDFSKPSISIFRRIRKYLWFLGVFKEDTCPICHKKLLPHWTYRGSWSCKDKDCDFNRII